MNRTDSEDLFIEFVCHGKDYDQVPEPLPAAREIPEWYRDLETTFDDGKSTVKLCRPFFDALTTGWIVPLATDVDVEATEAGDVQFDYDYEIPLVHSHGAGQMGPGTPYEDMTVLQWLSPWRIRVPEGFSVLVTSPMNRREPRFSTFSGIVDFDRGFFHVNSPFVWEAYPYSGTVERGTPIVHLVPFSRSGVVTDAKIRRMDEADAEEAKRELEQKRGNFSRYREEKWVPKRGARVIERE